MSECGKSVNSGKTSLVVRGKRVAFYLAIAVGLMFLGYMICPGPPGEDVADPYEIAEKSVKAGERVVQGRQFPLPSLGGGVTPIIEGDDVIAGRPAWVLRMKPEVKRVSWRQFWIDKSTSTVLAYREWSGENKLVKSAKVTSDSL